MKKVIVLILFLFTMFGASIGAEAGDATVSWDAPILDIEGGPAVVVGYKVYYAKEGTFPSQTQTVADVGNVVSYHIAPLSVGKWYFAVTAYNDGGESLHSNVVSKDIIQPINTPPTGCRVQ